MSSQPLLFEVGRPGLPPNVTVFASGANEAREIRGFQLAGVSVGVAVSHVREEAVSQLISSTLPVFADSGAFSEVSFTAEGPRVVSEITHDEWLRRLSIYLRLAKALHSNLTIVAPDRVADQTVTLQRLQRYRGQLHEIAKYGVEVLLPVQNGELSPAEFYRRAVAVAGLPLIPAMPMKKAATSFAGVIAFVREIRPPRLHLLGMGYERSRARLLVRTLQAVAPDMRISMDSNRIRAVTGKERSMTRLEAALRSEEPESVFGEVEAEALKLANSYLDYTDVIASPSAWASQGDLELIAAQCDLSRCAREAFFSSPDEFLQTPYECNEDIAYIELPHISHALDAAWQRHVCAEHDRAVRTAAIRQTFSGARIAVASYGDL
jgi:hypothetical protein